MLQLLKSRAQEDPGPQPRSDDRGDTLGGDHPLLALEAAVAQPTSLQRNPSGIQAGGVQGGQEVTFGGALEAGLQVPVLSPLEPLQARADPHAALLAVISQPWLGSAVTLMSDAAMICAGSHPGSGDSAARRCGSGHALIPVAGPPAVSAAWAGQPSDHASGCEH